MDHEIPVRIVDNQEYMKVVRSLLEEGKEDKLITTTINPDSIFTKRKSTSYYVT